MSLPDTIGIAIYFGYIRLPENKCGYNAEKRKKRIIRRKGFIAHHDDHCQDRNTKYHSGQQDKTIYDKV
jgi:hypothetical protein